MSLKQEGAQCTFVPKHKVAYFEELSCKIGSLPMFPGAIRSTGRQEVIWTSTGCTDAVSKFYDALCRAFLVLMQEVPYLLMRATD